MIEVKESLRSEAEDWFKKNNEKYEFTHLYYKDGPLYMDRGPSKIPVTAGKEMEEEIINYYVDNKEVLLEAFESLKQPDEERRVGMVIMYWKDLKACAEKNKHK